MSGRDPNHETPENIVVHGQDGHEFEVDELQDKELDQPAGGISRVKDKYIKPKVHGSKYIDKTDGDLM